MKEHVLSRDCFFRTWSIVVHWDEAFLLGLSLVSNFIQNDFIMDLETRKIKFIQEFLKLRSEKAITRLEKLLKIEKEWDAGEISPMKLEEFYARIDKSMDDSKKGRLTELDQLFSEIKGWK